MREGGERERKRERERVYIGGREGKQGERGREEK